MNFLMHQSFGSKDFQSRDRNVSGFIKNNFFVFQK